MADYRRWFEVHRRSLPQLDYIINGHILPELAHLDANKLTPARIRAFHEKLAATPARLRTRPGEKQRYREAALTEDERRPHKASANKILNMTQSRL